MSIFERKSHVEEGQKHGRESIELSPKAQKISEGLKFLAEERRIGQRISP